MDLASAESSTDSSLELENLHPNNATPNPVEQNARKFHHLANLAGIVEVKTMITAAKLAGDSTMVESLKDKNEITEAQCNILKGEKKRKLWQQTKELRVTILVTAFAALMQGWQQSTINASSPGWQQDLGNPSQLIVGATNATPFLSGAILGAWISDPLQSSLIGRRNALMIAAILCTGFAWGTAICQTWSALLACRVGLGLGIGAKASIAPVFAAEVAPDHLRGRLVTMWQLFDTFGIFLGFVCAFAVELICPQHSWRLLLATSMMPALGLLVVVPLCPESPHYLIRREKYLEAYQTLCRLRELPLQAARDLFRISEDLENSLAVWERGNEQPRTLFGDGETSEYARKMNDMNFFTRVYDLVRIPQLRRTCAAAFLVMLLQQSSGINVLTFYSSNLFRDLTGSQPAVNGMNVGLGFINFACTIPVFFFIDGRGRRPLLLLSLVGMTITLFGASLSFLAPNQVVRAVLVAVFSIGLFTPFYSVGVGPVPYTYSVEIFPLAFREVGMSFSVMVNFLGLAALVWCVPFSYTGTDTGTTLDNQRNILLAFTGFNFLTIILVFLFIPETKWLSLERVNRIFDDTFPKLAKQHATANRGRVGRAEELDSEN